MQRKWPRTRSRCSTWSARCSEQNVELPSGRVENLDREMTIQTRGELKTAEQFNRLVIRNDGANLVRLRDIGQAREGRGKRAHHRAFQRKPVRGARRGEAIAGNTVEVAEGIKTEMERIKDAVPEGI